MLHNNPQEHASQPYSVTWPSRSSPDATSLAEVYYTTELSCINILTGKKMKNTNTEYLSLC